MYRISQSTPVICLPVNIRKNVSYAMRVDWKKTERQPWSKYKVAGHVCLCASQFRHAYQSILTMKSVYQFWWRVYGFVGELTVRNRGVSHVPLINLLRRKECWHASIKGVTLIYSMRSNKLVIHYYLNVQLSPNSSFDAAVDTLSYYYAISRNKNHIVEYYIEYMFDTSQITNLLVYYCHL